MSPVAQAVGAPRGARVFLCASRAAPASVPGPLPALDFGKIQYFGVEWQSRELSPAGVYCWLPRRSQGKKVVDVYGSASVTQTRYAGRAEAVSAGLMLVERERETLDSEAWVRLLQHRGQAFVRKVDSSVINDFVTDGLGEPAQLSLDGVAASRWRARSKGSVGQVVASFNLHDDQCVIRVRVRKGGAEDVVAKLRVGLEDIELEGVELGLRTIMETMADFALRQSLLLAGVDVLRQFRMEKLSRTETASRLLELDALFNPMARAVVPVVLWNALAGAFALEASWNRILQRFLLLGGSLPRDCER